MAPLPSRPWKRKRVDLQPGAVPHNLGGSEAFAPDPADPEIDTRASQPHREKKKHAHQNTVRSMVHVARCVSARVVGGVVLDPRFVFGWLALQNLAREVAFGTSGR